MSPSDHNHGTLVQVSAPKSEWSTSLLEIKRPTSVWIYACCLPCCAMATARHEYDDSDFIFNLLTLNPTMARNIIRSGYGIEGNPISDIVAPCVLQPCAVAQMVEEVRKRGPVTKPGAGKNEWKHGMFEFDMTACIYAWCFPQCSVAEARRRFDDSNYVLNCLCSSTALNRSIIRQGYELEGTCMMDLILSCFLPCCVNAQLLQETKKRGRVAPQKPAAAGMN